MGNFKFLHYKLLEMSGVGIMGQREQGMDVRSQNI